MLVKYSEINTPQVIIILFLFYSLRSLNNLRYKKKTDLLLASSGCCDIKISSSIVCPCAYCNVPTFTLNIQNSIINLSISKFSNIDWLNINKNNSKLNVCNYHQHGDKKRKRCHCTITILDTAVGYWLHWHNSHGSRAFIITAKSQQTAVSASRI